MVEAYQKLIEYQMISWAAAYLSYAGRELWPQTEIRFCSRLLSPLDERGHSSAVKLSAGILQSFIPYPLVKRMLSKTSGCDIAMMLIRYLSEDQALLLHIDCCSESVYQPNKECQIVHCDRRGHSVRLEGVLIILGTFAPAVSTPAVNMCSGAIYMPGALIRCYCKHQVSIYFDYYPRITAHLMLFALWLGGGRCYYLRLFRNQLIGSKKHLGDRPTKGSIRDNSAQKQYSVHRRLYRRRCVHCAPPTRQRRTTRITKGNLWRGAYNHEHQSRRDQYFFRADRRAAESVRVLRSTLSLRRYLPGVPAHARSVGVAGAASLGAWTVL
jgi:hypothetical protein